MQITALMTLIIVAIYIVVEMNKSQKILKSNWFINLDRNDKIKITTFLKDFWKKDIILVALLVCWIMIIIATFIGDGINYEQQVSILAILYSAITIVILILGKKKYYSDINNFKGK